MDTLLPFSQFVAVGLGGAAVLSVALAVALRGLRRLVRRTRDYVTIQDVRPGDGEYLA